MSYPGSHIIRTGWMAKLPYPVQLVLPPASKPDTRTQIRTVGPILDVTVPQDTTRHDKLGLFLNAWGALESTLTMLLAKILEIRIGEAHLIFPKLGTKNAVDLLDGLGRRKLAPADAEALTNLLERLGKMNTKRNILVHGRWVLEASVLNRKGQAVLVTQFLRETTPTDPDVEFAASNPKNQKERVRYTFTLKRMIAAARDTDTLNIDFGRFTGAMRFKEKSVAEILELLARSPPYRVTYSMR